MRHKIATPIFQTYILPSQGFLEVANLLEEATGGTALVGSYGLFKFKYDGCACILIRDMFNAGHCSQAKGTSWPTRGSSGLNDGGLAPLPEEPDLRVQMMEAEVAPLPEEPDLRV
ncbi:hypothetical protein V6N11_055370 [Hibiscus sabdariffa]|uniref:Uncharacterized protein n=1 Tax=Hibiscus sabdariffa TaxID=183260 RepID=A0ABR2PF46_9ROSI